MHSNSWAKRIRAAMRSMRIPDGPTKTACYACGSERNVLGQHHPILMYSCLSISPDLIQALATSCPVEYHTFGNFIGNSMNSRSNAMREGRPMTCGWHTKLNSPPQR